MCKTDFEKPWTPKLVVERNIQLNVPVYQRLFVWRREQIAKLLNDLREASIAGGTDTGTNPYSIGVVSVWADPRKNGAWDLVDGQQRLTFLSLFAAWAVSKASEYPETANDWRKFLFADSANETLRLRFTGRPEDEAAIKAIANKELANGKIPQSGSFRIFVETTDEFAARHESELGRLFEFVYSRCEFLADSLPDGYGPHELNLHFEKMNSTGRQLEPIDLVKGMFFSEKDLPERWKKDLPERWNKVFRASGRQESEKKSIADILAQPEDDDAPKAGNNSAQSDDSENETERLVSDEVLLLHTLALTSKSAQAVSLDKSRLLEMFAREVKVKGGSADGSVDAGVFIDALEAYAAWMDKHIVRIAKDEKGGGNKYVFVSGKADENDASENLDVAADGEERDADNALRRKLRQFESMLYVSSDDSQKWILEAYRRAAKGDLQNDALLETLKEIDAAAHELPVSENAAAWCYPAIDRYWFWKLDYLLWAKHESDKADPLFQSLKPEDHAAISGYVFRRDRSIEHLHPQNPPDGSESPDWLDDRAEKGDRVRNGFGNLAMIASWFNSAQGNDSVSTKMGRIDDQVREKRLQSIKLLLMVRSVQSNPQGWTVDAAKKHESEMLDVLLQSPPDGQQS